MTSTTDIQQPNTILGAGKDAQIPEEHRKALEAQDKPFESFTQREQIAILHSQVDGLRTGYAFMTESLIKQAGALQCAMGILKQLKPEWTISPVATAQGERWVVKDEEGKVVESIFEVKAQESRPVEE